MFQLPSLTFSSITLFSSGEDIWVNEADLVLSVPSNDFKYIEKCALCKSGGLPTFVCGHVSCNAHFHLKDLLVSHELMVKHSCPKHCKICLNLEKFSAPNTVPSPNTPTSSLSSPLPPPPPPSSPKTEHSSKTGKAKPHSDDTVSLVISQEIKQKFSFDFEKISAGVVIPIPKEINCNIILTRYMEQLKDEDYEKAGITKSHYNDIVLGIEDTFNVALPRTLLYKNERKQWGQYVTQMENDARVMAKKPSLVFGAEHLSRLLVTLPNLLIESNVVREKWNPIIIVSNGILKFIGDNLATFWTDGYSEITDY